MITNYELLTAFIAASEFEDRIPTLTKANIAEVGNAILEYEPAKNAFIDELFNKIGRTLVTNDTYANAFAQFRAPDLQYGDTIEDIFVETRKSKNYDPTNKDPFGQEANAIQVCYHTEDRKKFYKATVSDVQLKAAFTSPQGLADLVNGIVASLMTAKNYDDFVQAKKLLSKEDHYGKIEKIELFEEDETLKTNNVIYGDLIRKIKGVVSAMKFMSTDYNALEVLTYTPEDQMLLVMTSEAKNAIDMDVLSGVFNMSKMDLNTQIIEIDKFDIDEESEVVPFCALIDRRGLKIVNTLTSTKSIYNPEALYTNYFLHTWDLFSFSLFRNAVLFGYDVPEEPEAPIEG